MRTGHINEDGIIERIHTLHINVSGGEKTFSNAADNEIRSSGDEETFYNDSDNGILSFNSEKENDDEKIVHIFERLNWADEID